MTIELQQRVALYANESLLRAILVLQAPDTNIATKDQLALMILDRTRLPMRGH